MLLDIVLVFVFICGITGMIAVTYKKIPRLLEYKNIDKKEKINPIPVLINKIKEIPAIKYFSVDGFLQKILSRIKILVMKVENSISLKLAELRERSQKKSAQKDDNYWKELNGEKDAQPEDKNGKKKKPRTLKKNIKKI